MRVLQRRTSGAGRAVAIILLLLFLLGHSDEVSSGHADLILALAQIFLPLIWDWRFGVRVSDAELVSAVERETLARWILLLRVVDFLVPANGATMEDVDFIHAVGVHSSKPSGPRILGTYLRWDQVAFSKARLAKALDGLEDGVL
ncbi:hypothetical protein PG984_006550 [Apiospora sp. TS-2023a]